MWHVITHRWIGWQNSCGVSDIHDGVTGPLWGKSTGHRWIPLTKASYAKFVVFFEVRLNKRLSEQSRCRWLETQWRPVLRHYNVLWSCLTIEPHSPGPVSHYGDVIMGAIASQITSLTIVYSTVYSDADQRKHQNSTSLAFVRGINRGPVNSPHKWPVTRKMFPFDDVIITGARLDARTYTFAHPIWRTTNAAGKQGAISPILPVFCKYYLCDAIMLIKLSMVWPWVTGITTLEVAIVVVNFARDARMNTVNVCRMRERIKQDARTSLLMRERTHIVHCGSFY